MTPDREPSKTLADVRAKSKMIDHLKDRRDRGGFKSVGDALTLQQTLRERERIMGELPPLRLVN